MAIGYFLGLRPTGGFKLSLDQIEVKGGALILHTTERKPGLGCVVSFEATSPFMFIVTPRFPGDVLAEPVLVVHDCRK
jgi:hypothetical protein